MLCGLRKRHRVESAREPMGALNKLLMAAPLLYNCVSYSFDSVEEKGTHNSFTKSMLFTPRAPSAGPERHRARISPSGLRA